MYKYLKNRNLTAFEINFYYSAVALFISCALTIGSGQAEEVKNIFLMPLEDKYYGLRMSLILMGFLGMVYSINSNYVVFFFGPIGFNVLEVIRAVMFNDFAKYMAINEEILDG